MAYSKEEALPQRANQVFTCAKCPARYFKLDALEYHMTLHGSNNRFKCRECDYSSKTSQNLMKHEVVHRRQEERQPARHPPQMGQTVEPQFESNMRGNPNFVYQGYLRNGRLKEKRYKCHKCPSAFEKREQYRVHLTLHGAKQRYCCDMCDYSVKYYANYVQHLKKHEANAQAQASRRQFEHEASIELELAEFTFARSRKSLNRCSKSQSNQPHSGGQTSNQDRQAMMLLQRRGVPSSVVDIDSIRCTNCPFSTSDKEMMDAHKRRHGIERMIPSCPHCDYVPKKDENAGEHVKLHFTRLYKPESYVIVELVSLTMRRTNEGEKKEEEEEEELLFQECSEGKFLPENGGNTVSVMVNGIQERVIVDPLTGETKQQTA